MQNMFELKRFLCSLCSFYTEGGWVCLLRGWGGLPSEGDLPSHNAMGQAHPLRMTDTCKNITFP